MSMHPVDIGPWQLALGLFFVILAQALSLVYKLGLVRDLAIGTLRTFAQLMLMGYVLVIVFQVDYVAVTLGVFGIMLLTAVHTVRGRVKERSIPYLLPLGFSMFVSYFTVSILVTSVVVQADPWWNPVYFIPLSGMVVGNSMTAMAIALDRLFTSLRTRRNEVEMRLTIGADYREASAEITREAVRAGMIPSITSMMGVGLVFIPGMMTGQILSGTDPMLAIRYQIVVMLMLVGSTAIGSTLTVLLVRRRCFGKGHQLLLPPQ
ncbi:putative ABC transport system permease protein [Paucidesulfovibrio gracilis DSM 16080]|uniref:Putative ABC transport system permease protein n=1 Tax=Paucidesulfovibrio gracilis DSM 16080 TaxID=1121449 RepID=A0A1T4W340_9BACT|nr:iron export ABC transporter permease subunit FetB [Paucidesulfovibrio gracilis]SKA71672.1 putative ABC transport system permease protein [Paucidesulfovibrio gracilis DSM 16080]